MNDFYWPVCVGDNTNNSASFIFLRWPKVIPIFAEIGARTRMSAVYPTMSKRVYCTESHTYLQRRYRSHDTIYIYKLVRMCPTAFEFNISSVFMVIATNVCISYTYRDLTVLQSFRNK